MHPKALGVGYCPLVKAVVLSPGCKLTSPGGLKQLTVSWPHDRVVTLESEGKAWEKVSFSFLKKFIYFLAVLGFHCCEVFSLAGESGVTL